MPGALALGIIESLTGRGDHLISREIAVVVDELLELLPRHQGVPRARLRVLNLDWLVGPVPVLLSPRVSFR